MKHIKKFEDFKLINEGLRSNGHKRIPTKLLDSMFNKLNDNETYNIIIDDRNVVCKMVMDNLECWGNSDGFREHLSIDIYLQENVNKKDIDDNGDVKYSQSVVYYTFKDFDLYKKEFIFADKESYIKFISNSKLHDKIFADKNKNGKIDFLNAFSYKNIDENYIDVIINGKSKKAIYKGNLFITSKGKKYYYDKEDGPEIKFKNEQDAQEFFNQCEK